MSSDRIPALECGRDGLAVAGLLREGTNFLRGRNAPVTSLDMMRPPITPGEILKEEYLEPLGLSQNALARAIRVSPRSINEIVLGRRAITAPMSIRLGAYFRQNPRFWLNIQTECDLRRALREEKALTSGITPCRAVAEDGGPYGK